MSKNIMLVDNSTSVLESLKWMLKDEPYYLFPFDNPFKALSFIDRTGVAVVVIDQIVSEISGVEFLKIVKEKSPYTVGILMTGYMDFEKKTDAVDKGYVYLFVKKPLMGQGLKQAIESALMNYESLAERNKQRYLNLG